MLKELPKPGIAAQGWPWTEETDVKLYDALSGWPKISIVTPSYNQGKFIEETIRSVLLQNYPNLEYIIIDGGSTDDTVEIIKKYDRYINYWISEKDGGQSNAINKGFSKANGIIFNWVNSDDFLVKNSLFNIANAWLKNPEAVAWVGTAYMIDEIENSTTKFISKPGNKFDYGHWYYTAHIMQPACFFKKTAWLEVAGVNENLHYTMDIDLWMRMSGLGKFVVIDEDIVCIHRHPDIKSDNALMREAEKIAINIYNGNPKRASEILQEYHQYVNLKVDFNLLKKSELTYKEISRYLFYKIKRSIKQVVKK